MSGYYGCGGQGVQTCGALLGGVCESQAAVDRVRDGQVQLRLVPIAVIFESVTDDLGDCLVCLALRNCVVHWIEVVLSPVLFAGKHMEALAASGVDHLALVLLDGLERKGRTAHSCAAELVQLGPTLLGILERHILVVERLRHDLRRLDHLLEPWNLADVIEEQIEAVLGACRHIDMRVLLLDLTSGDHTLPSRVENDACGELGAISLDLIRELLGIPVAILGHTKRVDTPASTHLHAHGYDGRMELTAPGKPRDTPGLLQEVD